MVVLTSPTKREINALSFSPDGRFLATGGSQMGVDVWDVMDRRLVRTAWAEAFYIHEVLFSPDGRHLFASATRGGARVINVADGRHWSITANPDGFAKSLALTPDQLLLVCVGGYGHPGTFLGAWDVRRPEEPKPVWRTPPITQFCEYALPGLTPDGQSFAVWESGPGRPLGGLIAIRATATGDLVREFPRPSPAEFYRRLIFTAGGSTLLVVSEPKIYCVNPATGALVRTVGKPGRGSFADLALHPNGQVMVSAHRGDRHVNVWDARRLSVRTTYAWPIGRFRSVALSPDGLLGAAGNESGKIVVWDMDPAESPGNTGVVR
jgi:WD40 repeat protein